MPPLCAGNPQDVARTEKDVFWPEAAFALRQLSTMILCSSFFLCATGKAPGKIAYLKGRFLHRCAFCLRFRQTNTKARCDTMPQAVARPQQDVSAASLACSLAISVPRTCPCYEAAFLCGVPPAIIAEHSFYTTLHLTTCHVLCATMPQKLLAPSRTFLHQQQ